jgi:YesN/AraC family two-component response regulator
MGGSSDKTLSGGLSLLYVEDADDVRGEVTLFLKGCAGQVYEASNGLEGLEIFRKYHPDLVITDIRMPQMDGIELTRKLHDISGGTPVIVTTAYNEVNYREQLTALGVKDFLVKPFLLDRLKDLVGKYQSVP